MKKISKGVDVLTKYFALLVLCVVGFAGIMSLINGDTLVVGAIAGVVVFLCAKELATKV